ncbi:hypothetical protein J2Z48_000839 [Croceifilum oryzae]|uniref:Uncharacterized protein n=1 Tax=Croceifilum oryzae TaxID=1553429 RepID=A0AAJ1THK2_9BACL|nr:hypothetical protein [Croceifilum oryzae]MDQ0416672.1 hypothetical protein [Croceifilum oryzae]
MKDLIKFTIEEANDYSPNFDQIIGTIKNWSSTDNHKKLFIYMAENAEEYVVDASADIFLYEKHEKIVGYIFFNLDLNPKGEIAFESRMLEIHKEEVEVEDILKRFKEIEEIKAFDGTEFSTSISFEDENSESVLKTLESWGIKVVFEEDDFFMDQQHREIYQQHLLYSERRCEIFPKKVDGKKLD